jgi:MFS family permease
MKNKKNEAFSEYSNLTKKEETEIPIQKTNFVSRLKGEATGRQLLLHKQNQDSLYHNTNLNILNNNNTNNTNNNNKSTEKINHIDNFIDSTGYTKYHFHLFCINAIIFFIIGSEFVITNLLLSTLKTEWNLSDNQVITLSSSLFVGILITSVLSGSINSNYGRRLPTIFGCLTLSIFSMLTSFADSFWIMLVIKVLVGIGIGTVIPSLTSLVTECIPNKNRSLVLNGVWGLYPLGIIYVCWLGIHFIKRNIFDWRTVCLLNSCTGIPVCLFTFYLDESPRYLFLKVTSHYKGDSTVDSTLSVVDENNALIKKGFEILNKLGKSVNKKLSDDDKQNIIAQLKEEKEKNEFAYERSVYLTNENKRKPLENIKFDSHLNNNNNNLNNNNLNLNNSLALNKNIRQKTKSKFSFRLFFMEENKFTSICLIFLWYLTSLISFGLLIVLPKHYEIILKNDKSESLKNMILTMYIFFVCPLVRGYISELSLGRRWTMVIGFSGAAVFSLICFFTESNLFVFSGILNFFINISLGVVGVYTSEFYDTLLRSGALGMGNAFTRIGGITAPFVSNFAESLMYKGSFLSFTLFSVIGAIMSYMLKESKELKIR